MATTKDGMEFYLVEARPRADGVDLDHVLGALSESVRAGDAVFRWEGRVMVAIAGEVPGAGAATRRLMKMTKERGIETKIVLVPEPFGEGLRDAAAEVITGGVNLTRRTIQESEPESVRWED